MNITKNDLEYLKLKAQKGIEVCTSVIRKIDEVLQAEQPIEEPVEEPEPVEEEIPEPIDENPEHPISHLTAEIIGKDIIQLSWNPNVDGFFDIEYYRPSVDKEWKHSVKKYVKKLIHTSELRYNIGVGMPIEGTLFRAKKARWTIFGTDFFTWYSPVVKAVYPKPVPRPEPVVEPIDEDEPKEENNTIIIDGITYPTVQIGNQIWLAQNLRNTFGIPEENNPKRWGKDFFPLCAVYGEIDIYGRLYNHYALDHFDLPDGWRVSSDEDWKKLESHLGMKSSELNEYGHRGHNEKVGTKLKSIEHFRPPVTATGNEKNYYNPDFTPATNETGFSGVPNGSLNPVDVRHDGANFYSLTRDADIWTSTVEQGQAIYRGLSFNQNSVFRTRHNRGLGMAVRLVK